MALEVVTKDCTQLSDTELAEMADLCAEGPSRYEIGALGKQAEAWVLTTLVRESNAMRGFSFSTLERIGGTPAVLIGAAVVKRHSKRDAVLRAIMADNYRRALMAFPDEDVLVGSKFNRSDAFEAYKVLVERIPRPEHKASGEERAWGRRLAKRFGLEAAYNDQTFLVTGDGAYPLVFDHESAKPDTLPADHEPFFEPLDHTRGDCIVTFGWIMAEELLKY